MAQERFTKLQKQGHLVPSMGSRLPKVDTGNKHVMFLSTDVLFTSDYSKEHEVSMCGMQDKWGDTVCVQHCN